MISEMFARVSGRKQQRQTQRAKDIRLLVELIAERELTGAKNDIDVDEFSKILELENWTEEELRRNVETVKRRHALAKVAAELQPRSAAAEAAEQAWRDADAAEGRRRAEALQRLAELEVEQSRAMRQRDEATEAQAALLDTAETSGEERELCASLANLNAQIASCQNACNPHARGWVANSAPLNGGLWPSLAENPAALAADTNVALKQRSLTGERRKQLESQLASAERAVVGRQRDLTSLEKQRVTVSSQLAALTAAKLLPANFALVRAKPRCDETQRDTAKQLGY